MKIEDNFLSDVDFNELYNHINNPYFPWYFYSKTFEDNYKDFEFQHTHIAFDHLKGGENGNTLKLFQPLLDKLNIKNLLRLKVNSNTQTQKLIKYKLHIDQPDILNSKTSIFYLNTNNGYTYFKDNTKVKSLKNRLITFDTNTLHSGTNCTDIPRRLLVNINYETN